MTEHVERRLDFSDPANRCFGCSPHNERGLRMQFVERAPGIVESRYTAAAHLCGKEGVIHGGVQAALLDEAMGAAIHSALEHSQEGDGSIATADFRLRYRRPAPTGVELRIVARVTRTEGRSHFVDGEILDARDERLTFAEARWVRIPDRKG